MKCAIAMAGIAKGALRFFHLGAHGVQVICSRDHWEQQDQRATERAKQNERVVRRTLRTGRRNPVPPQQPSGQQQGEPTQIKKKLHTKHPVSERTTRPLTRCNCLRIIRITQRQQVTGVPGSVLICLIVLPMFGGGVLFGQCGGPLPKNSLVGKPSKVIMFPVTVIRGPFLKITTRMSSGCAASGSGPQPLFKTTAGSPPCSSTGTKARAASKTRLAAVGLSHRTILVAWNVNSERMDGGVASAFHFAVPSRIPIQLRTPVRSGSDGSTMKVNLCPANRSKAGASCGIKARSGVRQDMLSRSSSKLRSASIALSCCLTSSAFASVKSLSNCRNCPAWTAFSFLLNQSTPAPAMKVSRSSITPLISNKFFQNSKESTDIREPLGRILDTTFIVCAVIAFLSPRGAGTAARVPA